MSFNVKVVSYPHKKEYRFYAKPVSENAPQVIERHNKGFWEESENITGDKIYINKESGEVRSEEDKNRCDSVSRKRSVDMITQYACCNVWEWFYTLTFDPQKVDSFDYDACYKAVHKFFNNLKSRKAPDLKYLAVPELHKSGRWHFHSLVANTGTLKYTESPIKGIYNIKGWSYGFTTATMVKDTKRVASYITKYITKEVGAQTYGKHRYLRSKNLELPLVEEQNMLPEEAEELKQQLLAKCEYFKQVKCADAHQSVMYIHVEE